MTQHNNTKTTDSLAVDSASAGSVCANCEHWMSAFDIYVGRKEYMPKNEGYCYKHRDYQCDGDTCEDFTKNH